MEILTLIKSNFKHKKGNFISIFILIFIISMSVTSILSVLTNQGDRYEKAMDHVNAGDIFLFILPDLFTDEMKNEMLGCESVSDIQTVSTITSTSFYSDNAKRTSSVYIESYDYSKYPYEVYNDNCNGFVDNPQEPAAGEIYVPISCKGLLKIDKGDKVYIDSYDGVKAFTVAGFVEEPLMGAEIMGVKAAFIGTADFNELYEKAANLTTTPAKDFKGLIRYTKVYTYATKEYKNNIAQLKKDINEASSIVDMCNIILDRPSSHDYTMLYTKILGGILLVFAILIFIIVLVVIAHSINSSIEMEYVTFGVLKSLGFTKGKLRAVLILQYSIASVAGIVAGMLASIPLIKAINSVFAELVGIMSSNRIQLAPSLAVMGAVLLVIILLMFIKTHKLAKIYPVRAISGGNESVYFKDRITNSVTGKSVLPIGFRLAVRQLMSDKKQYIGVGFIVAVLVFFLISISSLGEMGSARYIGELFGDFGGDIEINYGKYPELHDQAEQVIKEHTDIKYTVIMGNKYTTVDSMDHYTRIMRDCSYSNSVLDGRTPKYSNEIMVTEIVADQMNKSIGDTVTMTYKDKTSDFIIVGTFQCITDVGNSVMITEDGMKKLADDYILGDYIYKLEDNSDTAAIVKELQEKFADYSDYIAIYDSEEEMKAQFGTIVDAASFLAVTVYVISVICSIIIVAMVCTKVFIKEKKNIGIYKALGFTAKSLRLQFASRFAVVALAGGIIGVILNILLNNKMMTLMLSAMGITSFEAEYSFSSIIVPILMIAFLFAGFAFICTGKVKKVQVRDIVNE